MTDQPTTPSADGAAQETLRAQVHDAVKASGLKQTWIADKLNVSEKHLSQLLTGKVALTLDWAERILTLCGARRTVAVGDGAPVDYLAVAVRHLARIADALTAPLPSINANDIQGFCPACGHPTLYVGEGGYLTCSLMDCPEPDAASTLLEGGPDSARTAPDNPATSSDTADNRLREQYAAAMREHYLITNRDEADADGNMPCRCGDWREPGPMGSDEDDWDHHLAEAVLAVRDRRMEQLAAGRATWKAKAEEIERDRDRLAGAIDRVRAYAHELRHKDAMGLLAALDGPADPTPPADPPPTHGGNIGWNDPADIDRGADR